MLPAIDTAAPKARSGNVPLLSVRSDAVGKALAEFSVCGFLCPGNTIRRRPDIRKAVTADDPKASIE
jgi:hypothetical protein